MLHKHERVVGWKWCKCLAQGSNLLRLNQFFKKIIKFFETIIRLLMSKLTLSSTFKSRWRIVVIGLKTNLGFRKNGLHLTLYSLCFLGTHCLPSFLHKCNAFVGKCIVPLLEHTKTLFIPFMRMKE